MASLVTDSRLWAYLRCFMTRMNTIVRSVITCRQDPRVADPEQAVANTVPQQEIASDKFGTMFSKTKIHALFRSLLRIHRLDASDVDAEKAVHRSGSTHQEETCTTNHITPSTIKNVFPSNRIAREDDGLPVSPSLSISSILDMMPIPVTTPQERLLAASILASRNASPTRPTRPATPPLMSPSSFSSPGTSFFSESTASTTLNTPPPTHELIIHSTKPTVCFTPFLEQHPRFIGAPLCDLSVSLSMSSFFDPSEESGIYGHQGRRKRWTGHPGFTFPVNCGNGLFRVVEEEEHEVPVSASDSIVDFQEVSGTSPGNGSVVSDSPWDNGELESYGMKGKASWMHDMRSLDSADDQFYAWIRVEN
ncbi:hypothetical protein APHAL10511_007822 [Amanita phalloides]|nr:hypothetical protein APHAL10511_007822 [Amanita phalloides]